MILPEGGVYYTNAGAAWTEASFAFTSTGSTSAPGYNGGGSASVYGQNPGYEIYDSMDAVPEPGSLFLLGTPLLMAGMVGRKKHPTK